MKDRWEETLFHMAEQEQIIMPESLSDKIEEILCKPKNGKFHMNIRKSLILAAALILSVHGFHALFKRADRCDGGR